MAEERNLKKHIKLYKLRMKDVNDFKICQRYCLIIFLTKK